MRGGSKKYSLELLQIIMECLQVGVPPSAIEPVIKIFAQMFDPGFKFYDGLPSMLHIQCHQSLSMIVGKLTVVVQLSAFKTWEQIFGDGTTIGTIPLQDIIILGLEHDVFQPLVLLALAINHIGENSDEVCDLVTSTIANSGKYLMNLKEVSEREFPKYQHNLSLLSELGLYKLAGTHSNTDTCNPACKFQCCLNAKVIEAVREHKAAQKKWIDDWGSAIPWEPIDDVQAEHLYVAMCWHHLRNIWVGGAEKQLSWYLRESYPDAMKDISDAMGSETQDDGKTLSLSNIACACKRLFTSLGHYQKSDWVDFEAWMQDFHPDVSLMLLLRACSGARQDIFPESSLTILNNWPYYVKFIEYQMEFKDKRDNLLYRALYCVLPSKQMTAVLRTMGIIDVAIIKPHHALAGSAHLWHVNCEEWCGVSSMPLVADVIHAALLKIQENPSLIVNRHFMMGITAKWRTWPALSGGFQSSHVIPEFYE